jgi:Holliday junction resolvase RusA-like endonuclease
MPGSPRSNKRRLAALAGEIAPTARPDLDNYIKAALDAINTIVVTDDAQVVEIRARKQFSDQPKLVATIIPLDAVASNSRATQREVITAAEEAAP